MKIRIQYDPATTLVIGNFPTDINYKNNAIDEENKTIDRLPYIEVLPEEQDFSGEAMCVVNGVYQKYALTENVEQKKQRIKNDLKVSRQDYLNSTFQSAFEAMEDGIEHENKIKRFQAKQEIKNIDEAATLAALKEFSVTFK